MRNPSENRVKREARPFVDVPCGKCPECLAKRRRDWVLRMKIEYQYCLSCYSFTLTYDDEHINVDDTGRLVHVKRDVQNFIKLLRYYNTGDKPLKYFIVGEHGDKLGRPHYHCILFNLVVPDYYKTITDNWPYGNVQFGENQGAAYGYATKYYIKPDDSRFGKPFSLISKGIGLSYLTPANVSYHRASGDLAVRTFDGQTYFMPKYLRDKIWSHLELVRVMHDAVYKLKKQGVIKEPGSLEELENHVLFVQNRFENVSKKLHHQ